MSFFKKKQHYEAFPLYFVTDYLEDAQLAVFDFQQKSKSAF